MMLLEEAKTYANLLLLQISPMCDRALIAGSIRRGKLTINDIDFVVIPKAQKDLFWNAIAKRLQHIGLKKQKHGPKLMTYYHPRENFAVDIYRATHETWGILTLIRTGSKEHNVKLCNRALSLGLKLSAADGVLKDGQVIASGTEEAIFKALGMGYVPPERREVTT